MGFWGGLFKPVAEKRSMENPRVNLSDVFGIQGMFNMNTPLPPVSLDRALGIPAVWAAVNVIADTFAGLPLQLFKKKGESRELDKKDGLYAILHDAPNDGMHSFGWRKLLMTTTLTRGRSFTFIERNKLGRVTNLWLLDAANVTVERKNGAVFYRYRENGKETIYQAKEIIDIPFMMQSDGVRHYSPLAVLASSLALSVALEEYGARFFQNGGVPPMQLTGPFASPGAASRAGYDVGKNITEANLLKKLILAMPDGHELKAIGIDPEKSQMESARRFQIEEAARMYNIPPSFVQDLTHGNFTNSEQQALHFEKFTMHHWVRQFEMESNLKLFGRGDGNRFVECNMDGLLRGDYKTRMEGYAIGIQNAILKPDECRASENLPQADNGDKLYIQSATVPLGTQLSQQPKSAPKANT
jgi:HK97 family phage portal protein